MDKDVWKWFLVSFRPFWFQLSLLLLAAIVLGLVGAVQPIVMQQLVDAAVRGAFDTRRVVLMVVLSIISMVPLVYVMRSRLRDHYIYKMRGQLLQHLLRLDIAFHEDRGSTTVVTEASKGVGAAASLMNILFNGQLLVQVPIACFAAWYIGQESLVALALLVGFVCIFGFAAKTMGDKLSKVEAAYQDIDTAITARQREAIQHVSTVRVNDASDIETDRYWTEGVRALTLRNTLTFLYAKINMLGQASGSFAQVVVILLFLPRVVQGELSIGTFFALSMYASRVMSPASFLADLYAEVNRAGAMLKPLIAIEQARPLVTEQVYALDLNPLRQEITFSNVSFAYQGVQQPILSGVNLTIPAGKKTAIVGLSGAGKTTLARLLTRLYDPNEGVIEFDGTDVRNISFHSLYGQMAYLSQEVPIFTGTIEENVAFGHDSYEQDDVLLALHRASAGFINDGRGGIAAKIGEMGKKLSGGERQRIALARIFMRNPSIIILDEATSALDNVTEAHINAMFEVLSHEHIGQTMIVIAHRLSTVRDADLIVVLDKGAVVDTGTHSELLARCPLYQQLNQTFVET